MILIISSFFTQDSDDESTDDEDDEMLRNQKMAKLPVSIFRTASNNFEHLKHDFDTLDVLP